MDTPPLHRTNSAYAGDLPTNPFTSPATPANTPSTPPQHIRAKSVGASPISSPAAPQPLSQTPDACCGLMMQQTLIKVLFYAFIISLTIVAVTLAISNNPQLAHSFTPIFLTSTILTSLGLLYFMIQDCRKNQEVAVPAEPQLTGSLIQ